MSPLPRAIARASREPPDSDETLLLNPPRVQHSMQTRARDYSRGTRVVRETRPARTRTAPRRLRRGGPRLNPRPFPRANRPRAQLVAPHPRTSARKTEPSEFRLPGPLGRNDSFRVRESGNKPWFRRSTRIGKLTTPFALLIWPDPIGRVGKIPLPSGKKCVFGTETRCQIDLFAHKIFPKRRDSQKIPLSLAKNTPVCAENRGAK